MEPFRSVPIGNAIAWIFAPLGFGNWQATVATITGLIAKEEAIMELELSDKPFVLYRNARREVLQIVYRRPDGDYSIIELGTSL